MKFMRLGSKPDSFRTEGNNVRYVESELATDIIVNVGNFKFHLHKFPLLSKSAYLQKLVTSADNEGNDEIHMSDIPGGAHAFEICAKFCYGMTVTLNAYNVGAARCAAEYLEMYETLEKGNLIYKIEVFLNTSVFRGWKDSIIVLQSAKSLLPWCEDLKVVDRCVESIASKASIDTSKVEWSYSYNRKRLSSENDIQSEWNGVVKESLVPKDWWVEDLCELEIDFYKCVLLAIKSKGRNSGEVIGEALKALASRRIPGFKRGKFHTEIIKHQLLLETIIWMLPSEAGSVPCGFLLKLLKAVSMLNSSEVIKGELIKRIGLQLEEASVADLLIPAPKGENMKYDVGMVHGFVEEFIMREGSVRAIPMVPELLEIRSPSFPSVISKIAVAKLIDEYLAEISQDPNLPLSKFIDLAEMMSSDSRPVHDGLYQAIDMYLKEHPEVSKSEKRRVCKLMDCKKLSKEACMHVVMNDRLPLRVVVQVLYLEQARVAQSSCNAVRPNLPENIEALLPVETAESRGSSRSATTNTEEEWEMGPEELKSLKTEIASMRITAGINKSRDENGSEKSKSVIFKPKKILNKLWSGRSAAGDNSSSDSSANPEETKSTPFRDRRTSVS